MSPSLLRGYKYDTIFTKYCNRYHPCLVSQKCQNYDPSCRECFLCEQRVRNSKNLGGFQAESKYLPDIQLSVRMVSEFLQSSFSNQNAPGLKTTSKTLSAGWDDYQRAAEVQKEFSKHITWEE